LLAATGHSLSGKVLDGLVPARVFDGVIRRVLARAIATHGELQPEDVELILEEKSNHPPDSNSRVLPHQRKISDIGGLDNLKDCCYGAAARLLNGQGPVCLIRGLLVGIQGTGKSLTAKAIAHHWHLPRLDVGRLFGA